MESNLKFWLVDAFTSQRFKGNPAAVFVLKQELESSLMQNIAVEMNQSETAFVLLRPNQNPLLRWFTPTFEIDLCGHATLASAHVIFTEVNPDLKEIVFDTKFVGALRVEKSINGYTMDFPARAGDPLNPEEVPAFVIDALGGSRPQEAYKSRDLMLVYNDEETVRSFQPNWSALEKFDDYIIVTAQSKNSKYDFVSRFFCAGDGINEDPVTGSAHCTLAPYWADKLQKPILRAYQASSRSGELLVEMKADRVLISGSAVTVVEGILR